MSIKITLETIFEKIGGISKSRKKFLIELFELLPSIRGRMNFVNMARYSHYNELTFRRHFKEFFDWFSFNCLLFQMVMLCRQEAEIIIGAIDCSYINKAGKHTYGLDKFWSGVLNQTKRGLEVSLVCAINVATGHAWSLSIRQTPNGLSSKEEDDNFTRIDFYIEQLVMCMVEVPKIQYYKADGYYANKKVVDKALSWNKHLISKLRPDANLRYLLDRKKYPNAHGNKKYDGKVNWKALNLNKWLLVGRDEKYSHLLLYTQVLFSPQFKRNIKVVLVWNTRTNGYAVIFSTDTTQSAQEIVTYYQLRFKIEFIFRDAKQFTGLTHCQARDKDKLDFHFNMSVAALNVYNYQAVMEEKPLSLNSFVRKAYNTKFVQIFFDKLRKEPKLTVNFDIEHPIVQDIINLGQMRA